MDELPAAPPSRKEFRSYSSGLPDCPNLVARSTTTPWSGPHAVVPIWNDSTGPLRQKILEAVQDIDWNAIDILRCGSADFNDRHLVRPVILFVSVGPESTTWLNGRVPEMPRRSTRARKPPAAKPSPQIPTLQEEGFRRDSIQVSELLGTKIAPSRNPTPT
ncbi:hypothetical protein FDENT_9056 [Fusarium denticulatum]|uniref:Uncharacterized protein n=1 Tax=Fusarium denticulatum TaxID=48507 RepID=A0A8H5U1K5_9HYPO|nr:hypothetical protein FDENT_9056 [Fusarium denticulatum]